ncbi:MAG TPA: hypothetical protein VFA09_27390 [Ktedonobacteraceae bacterium]|nr:hypothetical protein [Ktedonobacteraceae bacterium]
MVYTMLYVGQDNGSDKIVGYPARPINRRWAQYIGPYEDVVAASSAWAGL